MSTPSCTVVVATCNRAAGLRRLLAALRRQNLNPSAFEVIVVDDGSTDETWDVLAAERPPFSLRSFWQHNQGPAAARNAAIAAAKGDIIITLDDDVEPAPDLLRRHLEAHASEGAIATIGPMVYPDREPLSPWVQWEYAGLQRQYESMRQGRWEPSYRQFYTANSAVPRWAYEKAGFFDPLFRRAEDVELAMRLADLGIKFRFLPDAVVYHRPNRSMEAWQRMAWQYGFYDIVLWRSKGRDFMISLMAYELQKKRSPLLRKAARLLVGRRVALMAFVVATSQTGNLVAKAGARTLAMSAYSAVFGLQYLQGAAEAFGDTRSFVAQLEGLSRGSGALRVRAR
ncbi:MAG TPA: glycosyltransferase [Dehalococcoidia bacterium]|nr:glycosyltransferase [Dehalococcoidia bacterium]